MEKEAKVCDLLLTVCLLFAAGFSRLRKPLGGEIAQLIPGSHKAEAICSLSCVAGCAHTDLVTHAALWVISLPLLKNKGAQFVS